MLTGWDRHAPLYDPMCGSGTLVIEAAMMALDMPPGALREFGFQKFLDHDVDKWQASRAEVMERASPPKPLEIFASDISGRELRRTRDNLAAAGLTNVVVTAEADVLEVPAPGKEGVLVTNPPYGVRIGETMDLAEFYPKLGDALKARFSGWNCYVFSGDPQFAKLIRLKATKRTPLFNGPLECRLYEHRMVSGSARKNAPDAEDTAQKEAGQ